MFIKKLHIIIFLLCINNIIYSQQNYKFENFGDKSTLLNGNVTGSVNDLGATFYNPSRLTTIKEPLFSINGKIYQLNTVKLKNYVSTNKDLKSTSFISLPRMVAGTFKIKALPNSSLAYSFLSKQRSDISLNLKTGLLTDDIIPTQEGNESYYGTVKISNKVNEEWYGVSWATKLSSIWSIGTSLYFSQFSAKGESKQSFAAISSSKDNAAAYDNAIAFEQTSYGLISKIGVAGIWPKVEIGLNIDLPYLELFGNGSLYQNEILAGIDAYDDRLSYNDFSDLKSKRKFPLGIQAGAGVKVKKSTLHFNLSWNAGLQAYDRIQIPTLQSETGELPQLYFKEELKNVLNFGAGFEFYITKKMNCYASYSSDFSPFVKNATVLDLFNQENQDVNIPTNFHHVGLGANFTISNLDFVLGGIYSSGKSSFSNPLNFPSILLEQTAEKATLIQARWRIIAGINISILNKKK